MYLNPGGQVVGVGRLGVTFSSNGMLTVSRDSKLDELIDAAGASPDLDAYRTRTRAVSQHIRQNHITVPLFEFGDILMTSASIEPWSFTKSSASWDLLSIVE
jgi:hypothetical protein